MALSPLKRPPPRSPRSPLPSPLTSHSYLQIDPTISLTIFESSSSIGGTWSRTRVHPHLLAQQQYGAYEFADLPIPADDVEDPKHTFIPSEKLHECIQTYAETFGVAEKVRFNATVTRVEKDGEGWGVWIGEERLKFDKLIMATGLTSTPVVPEIPREGFTKEVFHSKDVGERYEWLVSDEVSRVVVYGGGKSAQDAVYLCAEHGKKVEWIIRPDSVGNGAEGLYPTMLLGKTGNDAIASRFAAAQQPCLDLLQDWSYRFFHSGKWRLGWWIHWTWWGYLSKKMLDFVGYDKSENMKKLKPQVMDHGFATSHPLLCVLTTAAASGLHSLVCLPSPRQTNLTPRSLPRKPTRLHPPPPRWRPNHRPPRMYHTPLRHNRTPLTTFPHPHHHQRCNTSNRIPPNMQHPLPRHSRSDTRIHRPRCPR